MSKVVSSELSNAVVIVVVAVRGCGGVCFRGLFDVACPFDFVGCFAFGFL